MSSSAIILGLESSCDETAAALVATDRRILAQRIAGQEEAHRPFGGVVPEIAARAHVEVRSEEHTSELQSLMRSSYAVFCLKKKNDNNTISNNTMTTN